MRQYPAITNGLGDHRFARLGLAGLIARDDHAHAPPGAVSLALAHSRDVLWTGRRACAASTAGSDVGLQGTDHTWTPISPVA